jgi:hypothetical protein
MPTRYVSSWLAWGAVMSLTVLHHKLTENAHVSHDAMAFGLKGR